MHTRSKSGAFSSVSSVSSFRRTRRIGAGAAAVERLETRRLLAVGPEGYGYLANSSTFESIDLQPGASGVTTLLDNSYGDSVALDLGTNTFRFYGTSYTGSDQVFVTSTGLITFGSSYYDYYYYNSNSDLTGDPTQRTIAPLWDGWYGGQVLAKFQDTGGTSAPDRVVIEWSPTNDNDGSNSGVTFQAILQLNTGTAPGQITFNYPDVTTGVSQTNKGASATVGIKDAGAQGANRLLISQNNGSNSLLGDGKAIKITSTGGVEKSGTVVTVTGTDSEDTVNVTVSGANINIERNGVVTPFASSGVTRLEIRMRDGNDVVDCSTLTIPVSIDGGSENDTLTGGSGNDDIFGNDGNDLITANAGNDAIRGWNGADIIDAGIGNDVVLGGDGEDTISGGDGDDVLSGNAQKDRVFGGNGNDRLNGNGSHDRLYGEAGADRLYGYDGNDYLDGGSSNDRLEGGAGLDTLAGQGGDDRFYAKDNEIDQLFGGKDKDTALIDATDVLAAIEISSTT